MRISDWSSDVCSSDLASAPGADRVEDLLARMTLEEKVAQLEVVWTGKTGIFDANDQFDAAKMAKVYPDGIGGVARPSDAHGPISPRELPGRDVRSEEHSLNSSH